MKDKYDFSTGKRGAIDPMPVAKRESRFGLMMMC